MRTCIYPGSFDPLTLGHLDIIRRAAAQYDRVIVAVLNNPAKKGCFPVENRLQMIARACADIPNAESTAWEGLLVDLVRKTGACAVVRGLRGVSDFESEMIMAQLNARLLPGMETVFLMTSPDLQCVSSSAVREAASFGADISGFVPAEIAGEIQEHFRQ